MHLQKILTVLKSESTGDSAQPQRHYDVFIEDINRRVPSGSPHAESATPPHRDSCKKTLRICANLTTHPSRGRVGTCPPVPTRGYASVNNPITLISPVQSLGYICVATDSIYVALQISQQYSPKARTPTHWIPNSNEILTQNDHSRSLKVIRFGVNEEPVRGYIVQYNDYGVEC